MLSIVESPNCTLNAARLRELRPSEWEAMVAELTRRNFLVGTAALVGGVGMTGCGADSQDGQTGGATVAHAFGETTIPEDVSRAAIIGFNSGEAALALGVVPVGMPENTFAGGELPIWTEEAISRLGGERPDIYVEYGKTWAVDFEAIAATKPQVIIAVESAITDQDYQRLSDIAPTVPYPKAPWGTPWTEVIAMTGRALGLDNKGDQYVADLTDLITETASKYPEIKGRKVMYNMALPKGDVNVRAPIDSHAQYLEAIGLVTAPSVRAAATPGEFKIILSPELIEQFDDVEVLISMDLSLADMRAKPLWNAIPAVRDGAVVEVKVGTPQQASTLPNALSVPWGVEDYVARIAEAARRVR